MRVMTGTENLQQRTKTGRRSIWLAIAVVIGWLLFGSWAGPLSGQLSTVQENDNASFLPASAESTRAAQEQAKFAASDAVPLLVVFTRPDGGILTPTDLQDVKLFVQAIPAMPVAGGQAVGNYLEPIPLGAIPAEDGQAALANIPVRGDVAGNNLESGDLVLVGITDSVRDTAAEVLPNLSVNVTGPGGFLTDLIKVFGAIDTTLLIATAIVVAVILVLVYRSPFLWLIPLVAAGLALSTASAFVYILASNDILVLNGQSQGILTVLVFGAGTDYSLLLISRYREELHKFPTQFDAMRRALRGVAPPIIASAATTSIGLMCLLLSELNSNRSTGPVAATGIVAALLVMLTFLPAFLVIPSIVLPILAFLVPMIIGFALSLIVDISVAPFALAGAALAALTVVLWVVLGILRAKGRGPCTRERFPSGRWAFWPRVPRLGEPDAKLLGVWSKLARLIGTRPRFTWVVTALVLLVFAGFSTTLKTDGLSLNETFVNAETTDSVIGQERLARHFDAGLGSETVVIANADSLTAVESVVAATPGVASTARVTDAPPGAPAVPGAPPTVIDGLVQLQVTLANPSDSPEAERTVVDLRSALSAVPDADALVGGPTAVNVDINAANLRDRNLIIPLVLLVITIILIILLRALATPVILIATVVLSFFATLGACALAFSLIFGFPATDPSFPLFAFVFLVALGIDYNIFLMTRVREESLTLGTRPGILKGLTVTGGVITSAGIVLAATFLVLGVLPLVVLRQVGFAVALGVIIDTFIVRTLLVPALSYDIGRRIWWPSKLSRAPQPDRVSAS
jgi:RND superfamily putative drug exporter